MAASICGRQGHSRGQSTYCQYSGNDEGTVHPQIGRTKGLQDAVVTYGWNLLAEVPGEFTQAKGKEAMSTLLKQYDDINVVYCENDNEAFGATEAIEDAGYHVGSDIGQVISWSCLLTA